jgi:hypothetical protein
MRTVSQKARQLGLYDLECDARLALGELEMKADPSAGRSLLKELADESRSRGFPLLSRKATDLAASPTVVASIGSH